MIVCPGVRAALAGGLFWAGSIGAQVAAPVPATPAAPSIAAATPSDLAAPLADRPGINVPWPSAVAPAIDPVTSAAPKPAAAVSAGSTTIVTPDASTARGADFGGDIRYTVAVSGLDDKVLARFRADSELFKGRGAVANLAQINRRASEDRDLIDLLLRAQGCYGGKTTVTITSGSSAMVTLAVDPGPQYHVTSVTLAVPPHTQPGLVEGGIGVRAGDPLAAGTIVAGQEGLRAYLGSRGYAFPTIDPPAIVVDHATRTATLTQRVDPGAPGRFGKLRLAGASIIEQRELDRLARFAPGDPYSAVQLDDLRRALIATGLIGGVTLTPFAAGPAPDGGETIDIAVKTETAPLRTIAATAGYSTSQGIRTEASWQHRNLLPPNGAVTFRAVAAEREQLVGAELRRLNWRARDLYLTVDVSARNATQDAFNARTLTFGAAVARETNLIWQKKWYYSIATEAVLSSERDKSVTSNPLRTYYIAASPLSLTYDGSDNLLDPTRGFRLTGRASPEVSFQSGTFAYVKLQADATAYLPLVSRVTLAARGHLGTIAGASQGDIAPSRRFYSGGGGSVRGFGYQAVGPQAADGTPRGGNSVVEANLEARFRFGDFGVVPFFDAGEVDTATIPRFRDVRYGAGIGARYYTSFGPIRIDIATPLNPARGDAVVQFYVSIGQAF